MQLKFYILFISVAFYAVEDEFKQLVLDQLIRKEKMAKALSAEKEKLESIKKEINDITQLHETEESPKVKIKKPLAIIIIVQLCKNVSYT